MASAMRASTVNNDVNQIMEIIDLPRDLNYDTVVAVERDFYANGWRMCLETPSGKRYTESISGDKLASDPKYEMIKHQVVAMQTQNQRYMSGYSEARAMQNVRTNVPPPFPRSEQTMDAIMLRRVNARLRIIQDKKIRHLRHIGIATAVIVFAPIVIAAVLRMWGFALAWIAA